MWASKTAFITSIALIIFLISSTYLAGAESSFSISPDEFTVRRAPPMGEPWRIQQELVVWNRDNVERVVFVTAEIPPENAVRENYIPIPNDNWVIPIPSSILIPENSFAKIQIILNIPRWENLTDKKWEVWIPVERQPLPGEVGVLRPTVRLKIETTSELPPPPGGTNYLIFIAIGIVIVIVAVGVWIWSRRNGERKHKKIAHFPRQGVRILKI